MNMTIAWAPEGWRGGIQVCGRWVDERVASREGMSGKRFRFLEVCFVVATVVVGVGWI